MASRDSQKCNGFTIEDWIPDFLKLKQEAENPELAKVWDKIEAQCRQNLVMAFLGTANSGKTSAILTIFGFGSETDINPIPGWTGSVKLFEISDQVKVVDAPGFGDIRAGVSEQAYKLCDTVDLFLYILNAQGAFKKSEKEDFLKLQAYGKPVLVVFNKIDLIYPPGHLDELIEHTRSEMKVDPTNFIPASLRPDPRLSPTPINLDKVHNWIQQKLQTAGKDLLLAKILKDKDRICDKWIYSASASAAALGAIPIPALDFVPLSALQLGLLYKIAHLYDHPISKEDAGTLLAQLLARSVGKQAFRAILSAIKTAGLIPGPGMLVTAAVSAVAASVAASLTFGLGKAAQAYYKSGMDIPLDQLELIFKTAMDQYKSV